MASRRIMQLLCAAAAVVGMIGVPIPASAAPVLDQVADLIAPSTGASAWLSSSEPAAQLFVARATGSLTSVKIPLNRSGSGTSFTLSVYATTNGVPTGSALATSVNGWGQVVNLPSSNNASTWFEATFSSPPSVVAGQVYAAVVTTPDTQSPAFRWFSGTYCLPALYQPNGTWVTNPDSSSPELNTLALKTYVDGTAVPSGNPPAPIILDATPTPSGTSMTFAMCAGSGTSASFTNIEYDRAGTNAWTALSPAATSSPVVVPGPAYDTSTTIRLRSVDGSSTSAASVATTASARVPDAPTGITATAFALSSTTITFTAPNDNGAPITGYEYKLVSSGWLSAGSGTTSPLTITGMANGQAALQLRAVNSVGPGAASSITPVGPGVPFPPVALVATPTAGGMSVAFTPCFNGGSPVTGYQYDAGSGWTAVSPTRTSSPIVITGLTDGTPVSVLIRAVNAVADGYESQTLTVTPGVGQTPVAGTTTTCAVPDDSGSGGNSGGGSGGSSSGGNSGGGSTPATDTTSGGSSGTGATHGGTPATTAPILAQTLAQTLALAGLSTHPITAGVSQVSGNVANIPALASSGAAGRTPSQAATVQGAAGAPVRATVTGLPRNAKLFVDAQLDGPWKRLGTIKTGKRGRSTTPTIVVNDANDVMLRIGTKRRGWHYIRLDVS